MTEDILFNELPGRGGNIGEIVLNRPRVLNSLNLTMCVALNKQLTAWQQDKSIKAVVIRGEGDRAFCAGGDVKAVYDDHDDYDRMLEFFNEEYRMNKTIYHFDKPYISLLDGITMGGGAGVSLHGSHRVATERFSFAMPESIIGFYPDVGSAHFLNKCPGYFGQYLALTGLTIQVEDALALKLVDHLVAQNKLSPLLHTLCESKFGRDDFEVVTTIIKRFTHKAGHASLLENREMINHCFSKQSLEEIIDALSETNTSLSNRLVRDLLKRSPTSLKVTFAHLNQAADMEFDDIMQMNLNITSCFLKKNDFLEGVRALLVDKDQTPRWNPVNVSDVSDEQVAKFFIESKKLA